MVVIDLPAAADRGTLHDRVARPSMRTVQAPHWAMPQPYLVPVSFNESRSTHSNGVSGSTSTLWATPLTISEIDIAASSLCELIASPPARRCRDYAKKNCCLGCASAITRKRLPILNL